MPLDDKTLEAIAQDYLSAEDKFEPTGAVSVRYPDMTLDEAYKVQDLILDEKLKRGDTIVGMKVAATSQAIYEQFGLDAPLFGYLRESHRIPNGGSKPAMAFMNPHFETEMAFLLKSDLAGPGVSQEDALAAVEGVMGAFEVNDSRTDDWSKVGKLEIVADSCLIGAFVVSDDPVSPEGMDLAEVSVVVRRNGEVMAEAKGSEILGHPLNSLAWLANTIGERGMSLKARQVVLSGSMTRATHVEPGDTVEAEYDKLGKVSVSFP